MIPWKEYLQRDITIDDFTQMLLNREPFSYSRWGDGEFSAIFQIEGKNCDGHKYYPSLGNELESALKKQLFYGDRYYYGLVPIAVKVFEDRIHKYIIDEIVFKQHRPKWISGNILMKANREGKAGAFFAELRDFYNILYVGPGRLRPLHGDRFLNIGAWVNVPEVNAWASYEEILRETTFRLLERKCNMICFSAGMTTKVLMSDLKKMFGTILDVPMIDFGSMWDGYYGFNSRKYHHDYDWQEVRRLNLK